MIAQVVGPVVGPAVGSIVGSVLAIHKAWAWVVIIGNGLAGLWALGAHRIPALRTRALWWYTVAVETSVFVQVGLGTWMVSHEKRKPVQFHMFYGFVGIMAVAFLYAYRQQLKHRLFLLYGFGGLFIMGLAIRAIIVGNRVISGG